MAGFISNGICVDYHDGEGSATKNGRTIHWEFHRYCGPFFLRKDGEPLKIQPSPKHWVWPEFEKWFKKYEKARAKAKAHEIVKI
jgi:hypothetical protein